MASLCIIFRDRDHTLVEIHVEVNFSISWEIMDHVPLVAVFWRHLLQKLRKPIATCVQCFEIDFFRKKSLSLRINNDAPFPIPSQNRHIFQIFHLSSFPPVITIPTAIIDHQFLTLLQVIKCVLCPKTMLLQHPHEVVVRIFALPYVKIFVVGFW